MLDNYRDLIDELLGTPSSLRELAGTPEALPAGLLPLLAELRDRDTAVLDRVHRMTHESTPLLAPLPAPGEADPAAGATTLFADFERARGELVSLLMNLTLRDWERAAIDADGSEIVVADEVERHVEYDEEHVARIRRAFEGG